MRLLCMLTGVYPAWNNFLCRMTASGEHSSKKKTSWFDGA